jgi:hypothetical protein
LKKTFAVIIIGLLWLSVFAVFAPQVKAQVGLAGYWKFDEGSGNTAGDSSGNGNTGTLINSPTWVNEKYGKGLSFDGFDDYVRVEASSSLDVTNQVTLEAWVYARAYVDSVGNNPHLVSRVDLGGGSIYILNIYGGTHKIGFAVNPYPDQQPSVADLLLNTWTHLAMTYDGAYVRLYLNGQFDSSYTLSGPIQTTTNWFAIGCNPYGATWAHFNGMIDDVRVYNRALSQQEIQADMGSPSFEISVSPSNRTISPAKTTTYTLSVVSVSGFSSEVSLSAYVNPSSEYISLSFNPAIVTPPPDGSAQSILTVSTTNRVQYDFYTINIYAIAAGQIQSLTIKLTIADYELHFEIDYMTEHKPTDLVLSYIRSYYWDKKIAVFFYVNDEVPSDPIVTWNEFYAYEAEYNNMGDDKIFDEWVYYSRWKWVLFGTAWDGYPDALGRTQLSGTEAGNYIFIADQVGDSYAEANSGRTNPEEVETFTLMHEMGHSIGISNMKKNSEVYDRKSDSVMTYYNLYGYNEFLDERYSNCYWNLGDMEYYVV